MVVINRFFKFFWLFQLLIMKVKFFLDNIDYFILSKIKKFFEMSCFITTSLIIFILLFNQFFDINQNNNLTNILTPLIITTTLCFIVSHIDDVYDFIYFLFTTLRGYIFLSIVINFILTIAILQIFHLQADTYFFIVFIIIYIFISLLSNSNVSTTANTIIEILLALLSLLKTIISYYFNKKTIDIFSTSNFDEASKDELTKLFSVMENNFIDQIDLILLPLLFINGLTLLLCTIQSYWIKAYNDKREITSDYKLIEKYVTNKT